MSAERLVLRIDRLQLRGIAPEHQYAVAEALKAELTQAFAQPGVAASWAAGAHRPALRERLSPASDPAGTARDAAQRLAKAHGR